MMLGLSVPAWLYKDHLVRLIGWPFLPKMETPSAGTTRFAVIGDYGSGRLSEYDVARLIRSWNPDFITTVGDNNLPAGAAETIDRNIGRYFREFIAPYKGRYGTGAARNRFFPIPGHRDWDTERLRPYLEYFTLPGNERYYDFVWGPVHFFMLDSDEREPDGATVDSVQARWLKRELAASGEPWKLVYAHHGPYTSHRVPDIERMRWPFKEWGADAVLSGYYHVYERLSISGIPYFINGAGGAWLSQFGNVDPSSLFRYNSDYGAMLVDASAERITFRFITRRGEVVDSYEATKKMKTWKAPKEVLVK